MARLSDAQLRMLADDAFTVLNWTRRMGMNRARQIEETVRTFEVSLGYRSAINSAEGGKGDRPSGTFARPSAASREAATSEGQN